MGHARALVNVPEPEDQLDIFELILSEELSVRKVEELVRNLHSSERKKNETKAPKQKFPEEYSQLKEHLSNFFQTKVDFSLNNKGKGKIIVPFETANDLERIMGILDKLKD